MKSTVATRVRELFVPHGLMVVAGAALPYCGIAIPAGTAYLIALAICAMGALLAWRFHSPRVLLALLLLALITGIFMLSPADAAPGISVVLLLLFPLNVAVLLLIQDSSFDLEALGWWATLVGFQTAMAVAMYRLDAASLQRWVSHPWLLLTYALVSTGLLVKLLICRTVADSGLFWSTSVCFLAFRADEEQFRSADLALASLVLGIAVVESSYQVAFNDELTGLPGRRAFKRAIEALEDEYSIAMVDVDHFKRFNDTYGHDVGDQVLRMVASRLARVSGGGSAFRCGGEEFAILFPGRAEQASQHAEALRQLIEETPFVVRGPDRSKRERKERRAQQVKHNLRLESERTSVTVSIGVAEPNATLDNPEQVLQAADQALYRAKETGRNRVELYQFRRRVAMAR